MPYEIVVQRVAAHPIAAVKARIPAAEVPRRFGPLLSQVYDAAHAGAIALDGLNVFVYRDAPDGQVDVEFGVGVSGPFGAIGSVVYSQTPAGEAVMTTHWGEYHELGRAYEALKAWCREHGRCLAGPKWERYGHHSDDPATRRTDVYCLLD
jgi:effector-binding domain-containing protein